MVCVTGRTRPRRCPPRLRLKVPPEPLQVYRCPKVHHLYPQPRCGLGAASGSRCRSATDRGRSTPRVDPPPQCGTSLYFFFWGFSSSSGLAFPVPQCVRVWWCLCRVCVGALVAPLVLLCGACVGVAALVGPGAGVGPVGPFCESVFRSRFRSWRFFPGWAFDPARHTGRV